MCPLCLGQPSLIRRLTLNEPVTRLEASCHTLEPQHCCAEVRRRDSVERVLMNSRLPVSYYAIPRNAGMEACTLLRKARVYLFADGSQSGHVGYSFLKTLPLDCLSLYNDERVAVGATTTQFSVLRQVYLTELSLKPIVNISD